MSRRTESTASAIELAWELGIDGAEPIEGTALLRRENPSRLERALLEAGTKTPPSTSLRARTLAACLASARA